MGFLKHPENKCTQQPFFLILRRWNKFCSSDVGVGLRKMLNFFKSMVAGSGKREILINFLQKVSNQYGIGGLM